MAKEFINLKEKYNYWKIHVENWEQTNLTQAEYCRRNNLSIKTFGYHKRKILGVSKEIQSFLPVAIQADPVRAIEPEPSLRLLLQNGLKIEVEGDFNPGTLQKLIRAVEGV